MKDTRLNYVPVACGRCMECAKATARTWQTRLSEEIKKPIKAIFVTLTFSDYECSKLYNEIKDISYYDIDNRIATKAVRRFTELYRKYTKKTLRHWLITELGKNGTENIHLHGIIWSNEPYIIQKYSTLWKYGHTYPNNTTQPNYVNEQTINYIVKYCYKTDSLHTNYKPKILSSKGIGNNYINHKTKAKHKYKPNQTNEIYQTRAGIKTNLPIYYRNKIYTEEQREELWLDRFDRLRYGSYV